MRLEIYSSLEILSLGSHVDLPILPIKLLLTLDSIISIYIITERFSSAHWSNVMVDESLDHENVVTCNSTRGKFQKT